MSNEALAHLTRVRDRDVAYQRQIAREASDEAMRWRLRAVRAEAFAILLTVALLVGAVLVLAG